MVLELIAANEEARKERMAWEKQLSEIEDAKEQKRADSDRQMILTGMGQMIGAFTQYMGPAASSFPYPSSLPHNTPSFPPGYYQPYGRTFLPPEPSCWRRSESVLRVLVFTMQRERSNGFQAEGTLRAV